MRPTARLDDFEKKKNLVSLPGFESRIVQPVAYSEYAMHVLPTFKIPVKAVEQKGIKKNKQKWCITASTP